MEKHLEFNKHNRVVTKNQQKKFSILAMFLDRKTAKAASKTLKSYGFVDKNISLVMPSKKGSRDFVYHQVTGVKAGALIGALIGFLVLGLVGFIIGLKDPLELGVSSQITYTVMGIVIGLFFGAASGALVGVGAPKSASKRYEFYLREGGIVLIVHLNNEEDSLETNIILEKAGGQDIVVLEESQIWSTLMPENRRLTLH